MNKPVNIEYGIKWDHVYRKFTESFQRQRKKDIKLECYIQQFLINHGLRIIKEKSI